MPPRTSPHLDIGCRRISDSGLASFCGLTKLRELSLAGTSVRGPGFDALTTLENLEFLNLDETGITDEGLKHLVGLKSLTWLSLVGTETSDAAIRQLKQPLPELTVKK